MNKHQYKSIALAVSGSLLLILAFRAHVRGKQPRKVHFHPSQNFEEGEWDQVDEKSWESFPASDAPSHSPSFT